MVLSKLLAHKIWVKSHLDTEGEGRALAQAFRIDVDLAITGLNYALAYTEAETKALNIFLVILKPWLAKMIENLLVCLTLCEALPCVGNMHFQNIFVRVEGRIHGDGSSSSAFKRIGDKVDKHLLEPYMITQEPFGQGALLSHDWAFTQT